MITCVSIIGNIYDDERLNEEFQLISQRGLGEKIILNRVETKQTKLEKTTDKGTNVEVILEKRTVLRNGDVVYLTRDKIVVVELAPEKIAILALKPGIMEHDLFEVAVQIGHKLGKSHQPLKVRGRKIFVPVKSNTHMKRLEKKLGPSRELFEITMTEMIFNPDVSSNEK